MSVRRFRLNSVRQGLRPYRDFLAGNPAYVPAGYESISTINVTSNTLILTFSDIPQTYQSLQIRGLYRDNWNSDTNVNMFIRINADELANYAIETVEGTGSGVTVGVGANQQLLTVAASGLPNSSTANSFGALIIDIDDYATTARKKTIRAFAGNVTATNSTNRRVGVSTGFWNNTAAITSIQLFAGLGNFMAGSTFALYGIKASL